MGRWAFRFGIVVLVVLVAGAAYYLFWDRNEEVTPASYETAVVARDTIASTVSATGSIAPEDQISLSFPAPGRVTDVLVNAGQVVTAGQTLVTLDETDLVLALAEARVNLEISNAQLAKLETPASATDISSAESAAAVAGANVSAAEAAVASANAAYQQVLAGPTDAQQLVVKAKLAQAEVAVKNAQQAYDRVKNLPNLSMLPQAAELERATLALEVAKAESEIAAQPASAADLAAAQNAISQAQAKLEQARAELVKANNTLADLHAGPNTEDLDIARAQVQQAQLNVLQAENALTKTKLISPVNAVASAVNARPGEYSNTALPDVILTNLDSYHMEVLVDEIDVRLVEEGQPVSILVDALPDAELTGHITEIAPTAENIDGVVAYQVTIVPDPTDAPLRAGMSATAVITTTQMDDALTLPNRFIQLDRDTGQAYVYKLENGQPVLTEVRLGLRNERASQILEGVEEGDEVAQITESQQQQLRGVLFGNP